MQRTILRSAKWTVPLLFNCHSKRAKNDILLLSSPRSGSTILLNVIASEPRMRRISEPLSKPELEFYDILRLEPHVRYITLNDYEKSILKDYLTGIHPLDFFGPLNVFGKHFRFFTNRSVIKVLRANSLIHWFMDDLHFDVVYLIRHPLSQSLSYIRRGAPSEIEPFIEDDWFVSNYLDGNLLRFLRGIIKTKNPLERAVATWCLDNLIPLEATHRRGDLLSISYEQLVTEPRRIIRLLSQKLNLEHPRLMLNTMNVPSESSESSSNETRLMISRQDSRFLIKKWKTQISSGVERRMFEIIRNFGIDAYKQDNFKAEPPIHK